MEIFVQSFAREVLAGKKYLISEAYFTFVALDENRKAAQVIAVKPVTQSEKEQYDAALNRKRKRIQIKKNRV
jgi:acyl-CoA hydrolase